MRFIHHVVGGLLAVGIVLVPAYAQEESAKDSTGVPGENFSLQGALELFQKAGSPEEF